MFIHFQITFILVQHSENYFFLIRSVFKLFLNSFYLFRLAIIFDQMPKEILKIIEIKVKIIIFLIMQ